MNEVEQPVEKDRFEEILERLPPETRKDVKRASEVVPIPPGYLTSREVCIIYGGHEWVGPEMDGLSFYAREYVAHNKAPLVQLEDGRWVVRSSGLYENV